MWGCMWQVVHFTGISFGVCGDEVELMANMISYVIPKVRLK